MKSPLPQRQATSLLLEHPSSRAFCCMLETQVIYKRGVSKMLSRVQECCKVVDIRTPQSERSLWAAVKAMNATMRAVEYFISTVNY